MIQKYDFIKLAAQKMIDDNFVIFDTETTGISAEDEIVELGIIDCQGNVLYDGMFRPERAMSTAASRVSGITDSTLVMKPRFADEFEKIVEIMDVAGVIAFNEPFDEKMFYQTAQRYGLDTAELDRIFSKAHCAQQLYDQYIGYNKTKLELACENEGIIQVQSHRATDDCVMTLALLQRIADRKLEPDYEKYCAIRAKATGKSIEEVSRPLGGTSQKKVPINVEYVKMYQDGVSIEEIAKFKNVKTQTVEENLVNAFKDGILDSVDGLIQPHYEGAIRALMKEPGWNGRFTPIKNAMPDDCTWASIRATVAKVRKEEELCSVAPAPMGDSQHVLDEVISEAQSRAQEAKKAHGFEQERLFD